MTLQPGGSRDLSFMDRDRLLIVHDPGELSRLARTRYPQFEVRTARTYLAGIAAVSRHSPRSILVGLDPAARKLPQAISALRKAAGASTRLILCCTPALEPTARTVLDAGADDYLIYPPRGPELDKAIDVADEPVGGQAPGDVQPTWDEVSALASALSGLAEGRRATLERLCRMIGECMRSTSVKLVVGTDSVTTAGATFDPALSEAILGADGRALGRILVGARPRNPFSVSEVEKIRHYGRLIGHLMAAADQQQRWQRLAMIDEATQLPNRRYLMEALSGLIRRAGEERFRVTVLMFDLDGFKHFNDTYGHAAGDEVIRESGQLFHRCCRQHDIVARYAGDEFVVVFWDAEEPRVKGSGHPTDMFAVLRRFRKALETHEFPRLGPEAVGHITISGGLASFPWDARTAEELIERADQAMLEAKRAGKNRIYLVGPRGDSVEAPTGEESA